MRVRNPDAPNILLIMADQWRFDYLGCMGADFVRTPNIDALASRGRLFTHCCTNSPVCAPARQALASGLDPLRFGAAHNNSFLPARLTTYYQRLRDADYYVGAVGKLDHAKPDPYNGATGQRPANFRWGFTHPVECEGKMHAGQCPEPAGPYTNYLAERGWFESFRDDYTRRRDYGYERANWDSVIPTEGFEDIFIGRRACQWLRDIPKDYPWFLFVSFVGPHDPFDPPREYAERWRNAEVPPAVSAELNNRPAYIARRDCGYDAATVQTSRRQYLAACEAIDDMVGELLATLEETGEADNTYIIFTADHGEMLGDLGMWTKSVPYDPAVRVPLICTGPDIPPGTSSDALVSLFDLNPTCCEWAGLAPQPDIDARSIADLAAGNTDTHRDACLSTIRGFRALRTQAELFVVHDTGEREYYDMQADPHATANRADEQAEACQRLSQMLQHRCVDGAWHR